MESSTRDGGVSQSIRAAASAQKLSGSARLRACGPRPPVVMLATLAHVGVFCGQLTARSIDLPASSVSHRHGHSRTLQGRDEGALIPWV